MRRVAFVCSVDGCGEPHSCRGFCGRHYMAFRRYGDPTKVVVKRHYGKTPEERFWLYTQRGDGCWEWIGYKDLAGYGIVNIDRRLTRAHRFSYALHNGAVPDELHVLHRCDNPACVKPSHLFLGADAENMADMIAKGRDRKRPLRGSDSPRAKLTEVAVRAILASDETGVALAGRYGVTETTITDIRKRRSWKHIE